MITSWKHLPTSLLQKWNRDWIICRAAKNDRCQRMSRRGAQKDFDWKTPTTRENHSNHFRRQWQYATEKQATKMWDLCYAFMEIFLQKSPRMRTLSVSILGTLSRQKSESVCILKKKKSSYKGRSHLIIRAVSYLGQYGQTQVVINWNHPLSLFTAHLNMLDSSTAAKI